MNPFYIARTVIKWLGIAALVLVALFSLAVIVALALKYIETYGAGTFISVSLAFIGLFVVVAGVVGLFEWLNKKWKTWERNWYARKEEK